MFEIIGLAAAGVAGFTGYTQSRGFVRRKLRFVEAVQKSSAPAVAGFGALLVGSAVVSVLPFVGAGTALVFGTSVALGVAKGAKDIRSNRGYLPE